MYLTKEEEKLLNGELGEAKRIAIEVIVKVGEVLGADRLVHVSHAHVSGVSYYNVGEAGYEFVKDLHVKGAKAGVFSTLNPVGMDLDLWRRMGIDEAFVKRQLELLELLFSMGFVRVPTCTPYLLRRPGRGERLAWSESSAVGMANTVYGAFTNREPGPLALMASIVGRTYHAGLQVPENRRPTVRVRLKGLDRGFATDEGIASAVGYVVGELLGDAIPYLEAKVTPGFASLKAYTAAAGATGSIALTYVEGVTPGYEEFSEERLDAVEVDEKDVRRVIEERTLDPSEVEAVFVGCPHATEEEIARLLELLKACGRPRYRLIVSTSRHVYENLRRSGALKRLEELGVELLRDTCPVVSPAFTCAFRCVVTSSGKAYFYLPRHQGLRTRLLSLESLGELLCKGR